MTDRIWSAQLGEGPLVATAIHDGHEVREEVLQYMALDEPGRLREEDPFTAVWTKVTPTRIVGLRSRFEVDLNRSREKAIYRTPEDAWGLKVWKDVLPDEVAQRTLAGYDAFYRALGELYGQCARLHGAFVVFDLHSYNHRRDGPSKPAADPMGNPQIDVGTGTMHHRGRFAAVIERFMRDLRAFDFPGGKLDVRENVKFRGGHHAKWTHDKFPDNACVLAIEFKKFFMDEWTGEPDPVLVDALGQALACTVPGVLEELSRLNLT